MISAYDRVRIAAHIVANPRTVLRVYQGDGSDYSRRRVTDGAKALGLPPPGPSRRSPLEGTPVARVLRGRASPGACPEHALEFEV